MKEKGRRKKILFKEEDEKEEERDQLKGWIHKEGKNEIKEEEKERDK